MPCQSKETYVADCAVMLMSLPEAVLLDVGHTFHDEANGVKNNAGDVSPSTKGRLSELRDVWRVEDRHRQRTGPNPEHLAGKC